MKCIGFVTDIEPGYGNPFEDRIYGPDYIYTDENNSIWRKSAMTGHFWLYNNSDGQIWTKDSWDKAHSKVVSELLDEMMDIPE